MDQASKPVDLARALRIMHGALAAGVVLVGAVILLLVRVRGQAIWGGPTLGTALAVASALLLVVAALVLRPRIPDRNLQDSPETYWAMPRSRGAAIILWAVTEGASLIGWVGYLLTGATLPMVAGLLATVMLIWYRPSGLEGAA